MIPSTFTHTHTHTHNHTHTHTHTQTHTNMRTQTNIHKHTNALKSPCTTEENCKPISTLLSGTYSFQCTCGSLRPHVASFVNMSTKGAAFWSLLQTGAQATAIEHQQVTRRWAHRFHANDWEKKNTHKIVKLSEIKTKVFQTNLIDKRVLIARVNLRVVFWWHVVAEHRMLFPSGEHQMRVRASLHTRCVENKGPTLGLSKNRGVFLDNIEV